MANRSAQSRNHARGVNVGSSGLPCIRRGSDSSTENAARQEGQKNRASPVPPAARKAQRQIEPWLTRSSRNKDPRQFLVLGIISVPELVVVWMVGPMKTLPTALACEKPSHGRADFCGSKGLCLGAASSCKRGELSETHRSSNLGSESASPCSWRWFCHAVRLKPDTG
jgi:hypothetical protein